ncbi:MAG: lipase maturation factor family protein [Myxococcota bacterium]
MKPLLVYDGECGFCRRWIDRWRVTVGEHIDFAPYQEVHARFPQVPREDFARAVHFIEDGRITHGAQAVFRALSQGSRGQKLLWAYERVPLFASVAELFYRFVARHRTLAGRLTDSFLETKTESLVLTRAIYLRLFGLTALVAVGSFWSQLPGLIGSGGIWPAERSMAWARAQGGAGGILEVPTLAWLSTSDGFLHGLCAAAAVFSLLLIAHLAPRWAAAGLWACYLSLVAVGGPFLRFQWDILLIEASLMTFLYAPGGLRPRLLREPNPAPAATFMQRWLICRLMLLNGLVKVLGGDPAWRDLTAFRYHYWTQPLPTWTSFFAHQQPLWAHQGACALVIVIELVIPFIALWPRSGRRIAFVAFALMQLTVMATGNYSFFNLLTLVLCVPLLDDRVLRAVCPQRLRRWLEGLPVQVRRPWEFGRRAALWGVAVVVVALGVVLAATRFLPVRSPAPLARAVELATAFHLVNHYGAFSVMTKTRPEIIVEGSTDGTSWKTYGFRYKPGALARRPQFVAPLQPRLDWQMWFAALNVCENQPWFLELQKHLLEGTPAVLALLEENPFSEAPPRYVRTTVYQYRFASWQKWRERGEWWEREAQGPYCPPLTLEAGQLRRVALQEEFSP